MTLAQLDSPLVVSTITTEKKPVAKKKRKPRKKKPIDPSIETDSSSKA